MPVHKTRKNMKTLNNKEKQQKKKKKETFGLCSCMQKMKANDEKMGREKKKKTAFGLIDRIINRMPEIHIPSYQYAGPGTNLRKRLARGDPGKNKLDIACRDHDLAYATCEGTKNRRKADKVLIKRAFERIYSRDAKLDERAAALLVSGLMSAKVGLTKIGLGLGDRKTLKKMKGRKNQSITFNKLTRGVKESIKKTKSSASNRSPSKKIIQAAIRSARDMKRGKTVKKIPRVLKLPKFGGSLNTLLPILSGLSSIGSITASAVGVAKAIKDIQTAKKQLVKGNKRQLNMIGEKKIARGVNLIYKKTDRHARGSGFYLKPYHHGTSTSTQD